jgi:tRNA(fMet)-specific endonuclease VapC
MNDERPIRYVLDTDTTSAVQRRHPAVSRRLASVNPESVATTVVTLFEQLRGRLAAVNRATNMAALQTAYRLLAETHRYFCDNHVLPFDAVAADIFRSLRAQQPRTGTQDSQIAAIALANDAILVTSNRQDFERVPGLRIEDWTVP